MTFKIKTKKPKEKKLPDVYQASIKSKKTKEKKSSGVVSYKVPSRDWERKNIARYSGVRLWYINRNHDTDISDILVVDKIKHCEYISDEGILQRQAKFGYEVVVRKYNGEKRFGKFFETKKEAVAYAKSYMKEKN